MINVKRYLFLSVLLFILLFAGTVFAAQAKNSKADKIESLTLITTPVIDYKILTGTELSRVTTQRRVVTRGASDYWDRRMQRIKQNYARILKERYMRRFSWIIG